VILGVPRPRQQFVETVDRIAVNHALEHVLQICIRFTEFELRQTAAVRKDLNDEYQTSTTPLARSSQPRGSSKSIDQLGSAVVQEANQTMPARQPVPDRFGEGASSRQQRKLRLEPGARRRRLAWSDNDEPQAAEQATDRERQLRRQNSPMRRSAPTAVGAFVACATS
jgi:hypothetical protein